MPNGSTKIRPVQYFFGWRFALKKTLGNCLGPVKSAHVTRTILKLQQQAGNDSFSTRYDCFSLAIYNDSSSGES